MRRKYMFANISLQKKYKIRQAYRGKRASEEEHCKTGLMLLSLGDVEASIRQWKT